MQCPQCSQHFDPDHYAESTAITRYNYGVAPLPQFYCSRRCAALSLGGSWPRTSVEAPPAELVEATAQLLWRLYDSTSIHFDDASDFDKTERREAAGELLKAISELS